MIDTRDTHPCVSWVAADVAVPENDDASAWLTKARDAAPRFAPGDSVASGPGAPASGIASTNPCRPRPPASPRGPGSPAAAAAAVCHRGRAGRARPGDPAGRRGAVAAAAAAATPRSAACPAACPDATAW